jgi:hypothetical protein
MYIYAYLTIIIYTVVKAREWGQGRDQNKVPTRGVDDRHSIVTKHGRRA